MPMVVQHDQTVLGIDILGGELDVLVGNSRDLLEPDLTCVGNDGNLH